MPCSQVLEIYGKEYDVHWGEVTNTFTKVKALAKCQKMKMIRSVPYQEVASDWYNQNH